MSIKIFTLDKNNKISFTKDELEKLLNEAYWEGYHNNNNNTTTISYPSNPLNPYYYNWSDGTITVGGNSSITSNTTTPITPILETDNITNGEFNNVSSN